MKSDVIGYENLISLCNDQINIWNIVTNCGSHAWDFDICRDVSFNLEDVWDFSDTSWVEKGAKAVEIIQAGGEKAYGAVIGKGINSFDS